MPVEAKDRYRAVFACAELDAVTDKPVYLVTARDGKPLSGKDRRFMLVVPGEDRNGGARQMPALTIK